MMMVMMMAMAMVMVVTMMNAQRTAVMSADNE